MASAQDPSPRSPEDQQPPQELELEPQAAQSRLQPEAHDLAPAPQEARQAAPDELIKTPPEALPTPALPAQAATPEALASERADQVEEAVVPPSPFVTRLRGEVSRARRGPWEQCPSVVTWLTPRGRRQARRTDVDAAAPGAAAAGDRTSVSFAEGSTPRSQRPGPKELKFKGSGLTPFKLDGLTGDLSVRDLKALSERHCGIAPAEQRILVKGKILHDHQKLHELELREGAQLFIVRGSAAPAAGAAPSVVSAPTPQTPPEPEEPEEDDMDEEQLLHALIMGRLCRECGVNPGRLQTDGLCSVCFREIMLREHWLLKEKRREEEERRLEEEVLAEEKRKKQEEHDARQKDKTRCKMCNKKTGLTGFMCRCGFSHCATHRHAEDHDCSFDHQGHGREILAQQNPGS